MQVDYSKLWFRFKEMGHKNKTDLIEMAGISTNILAKLTKGEFISMDITRTELQSILDPHSVMGEDYPSETFRVLKDNEIAKYGEYRTQRLVLEAWDRME